MLYGDVLAPSSRFVPSASDGVQAVRYACKFGVEPPVRRAARRGTLGDAYPRPVFRRDVVRRLLPRERPPAAERGGASPIAHSSGRGTGVRGAEGGRRRNAARRCISATGSTICARDGKGPSAGLAFTEARIAAVNNLPPNSPERADANELKVQALVVGEHWGEAFPLIVEVVRVRRLARPPEPELLAGALLLEAIVRFALDQADDADAKLRESLAQYSVAFGADDLRYARQLELNAEQVQKGFARPTLVMEMLGKGGHHS